MATMKFAVATFRDAGFEARWSKTGNSVPCIMIRNSHTWYMVTPAMWALMLSHGVYEGFELATATANFFSVKC